MSTINNVQISENEQVLKLQEMHRFRSQFRNNALVLLRSKQMAVLHGPKHSAKGRAPPEFILKKTRTVADELRRSIKLRLRNASIGCSQCQCQDRSNPCSQQQHS